MAKKNITDLKEILINNLPMHYTRQPIEFTFLRQNLSLNQINFIIDIIDLLQDKINYTLNIGKDKDNKYPSLFADNSGDFVKLDVRLSSLNIAASHYDAVHAAVMSLLDLKMVYDDVDENGVEVTKYQPLISSISIPHTLVSSWNKYDKEGNLIKKGTRRAGAIHVEMRKDTANALFSLKQHTQFLKQITSSCNSQYTSRLYMCLSTYKDDVKHGCKWNVSYNDLRRIMGVTEFFELTSDGVFKDGHNEEVRFAEEDIEEVTDTGVWVRTKYAGYGQFNQNVIKKSQKDFEELNKNNGTDITFDVKEILPEGVKRGTPVRFIFTVHKTDVGKMIHKRNAELSMRSKWKNRFIVELDLKNSKAEELSNLITAETENIVNDTIKRVKQEIEKGKIKSTSLYYYKSIKNALNGSVPLAEEVISTDVPSSSDDNVSSDDMQMFASVLATVDKMWREAISLKSVEDDRAVVSMPAKATYDAFVNSCTDSVFKDLESKFGKKVTIVYENRL